MEKVAVKDVQVCWENIGMWGGGKVHGDTEPDGKPPAALNITWQECVCVETLHCASTRRGMWMYGNNTQRSSFQL